jgi:hypothetical protein
VESERRQAFFGAAIGIPTFYVHRDSGNLFLHRILRRTRGTRPSHRYPGYLRVYNREYHDRTNPTTPSPSSSRRGAS